MDSKLYQQVLGKDWLALAETIRHAHAIGREARGIFRITHGAGWLAKKLAHCSHLPRASNAADTCLTIFSDHSGERWERRFNGEIFISKQWESKTGQLIERFGEWELHFKLQVKEGNLFYEQFKAKLCVGALRIHLPLACAPRVSAKEIQDGVARILVSVRVTLPFIGLLISYEGHLNVEEGMQ